MKTFNGVDIYENLKEIVEPSRSCLVVWDVQQGLVNSIFNREAFLASLKTLVEGLRAGCPSCTHSLHPCPKRTSRVGACFP